MQIKKYDIRSLQPRKYLRASCIIFLGALCTFQVNAVTIGADGYQDLLAESRWRVFVRDMRANNQIPSAVRDGPFEVVAANGKATLSVPAKVAVGGQTIAVKRSMKAVAGATGKLAVALAKTMGPVGLGIAAYNLYSELDIALSKKPDGTLEGTQTVETIQYTWFRDNDEGPYGDLYAASCQIAARDGYTCYEDRGVTYNESNPLRLGAVQTLAVGYSWNSTYNRWNYQEQWSMGFYSVKSSGSTTKLLDEQMLIAAVESASGLSNGAVEDTIKAGLESGLDLEMDPDTGAVSGPSSTAPKVSTTTNPDGSTTTTTDKANITYQGNNINITNQSTVSNYNPTTNNTTTTETTTQNPDQPTPDMCDKDPDLLACQKPELDTPEGEIPKTSRAITYNAEDLGFGGGSCPADAVVNITGVGSVTAFDWVSACDKITTYAKPMILALAGFAALMIIFGGARPE